MTTPTPTVDVPKLGPVPRNAVIGIVGAAALFVAWRWWQARRAAAATPADATASDFQTSGLLPGVAGAVNADGTIPNAGGSNTDTVQTGGTGPGHFTSDAEWSAWVEANLPTDKWTLTDIVTALGAALAKRPTDPVQQQIVQSAIAVAGEPPEGPIVLISGGSTGITIAPAILSSSAGPTSVKLTVSPVAGAASYVAYRAGTSTPAGTSSTTEIEVDGLTPATPYSFTVAALSATGTAGPTGTAVSVKTLAALGAPTAPTISKATATSVTLSTKAIPGATSYEWRVNGADHAHTATPTYRYGTKPATAYRFSVRAIVDGHDTPVSPETTYTTKTK